jgi:hypothetical protein
MQRLVSSALVALLLGTSLAAARPSTLSMSCAIAAATVARAGAIVLSTGEHTYDRFVAHNGFCLPGQKAKPTFVPTADSDACAIGYTCIDSSRFTDDF